MNILSNAIDALEQHEQEGITALFRYLDHKLISVFLRSFAPLRLCAFAPLRLCVRYKNVVHLPENRCKENISRITIRTQVKNYNCVTISIKDNGTGITEEIRIFFFFLLPFYFLLLPYSVREQNFGWKFLLCRKMSNQPHY